MQTRANLTPIWRYYRQAAACAFCFDLRGFPAVICFGVPFFSRPGLSFAVQERVGEVLQPQRVRGGVVDVGDDRYAASLASGHRRFQHDSYKSKRADAPPGTRADHTGSDCETRQGTPA